MKTVLRHIGLCVRGVLLELWRRQDIWILLMLMGIFAVIAQGARLAGVDTPAAETFMLNLGITLAGLFAHFLAVSLAARQFPDECEHRTLYPLLARPLRRETLVLAKALASALGGILVYIAFFVLAWWSTPRLGTYPQATLLQHLALQPVSIAAAAALGTLAGLTLPRGVSLLMALGLVFGGETLFRSLAPHTALAHLLPRFGAMNLATRYTDGAGPLNVGAWLELFLYGLVWAALALLASALIFRRRPL